MIKEKLQLVWEWIKAKTKEILVTLGIVGLAFASPLTIENAQVDVNSLVKNRGHVNSLRVQDSEEVRGTTTKNYKASEKKLTIEGLTKRIEIKLTSPYIVSGLIASDDTKVAELTLIDYRNIDLFDSVQFYDVKNDYEEVQKTFTYKYAIEREVCEERCIVRTEWVKFNHLSDLPYKNIKIGIFTATEPGEKIEWIPKIYGFEILEWAEWDISTAVWTRLFDVSGKTGLPYSISFKPDGTEMYISQHDDDVFQYTLGTGWDISSAGYTATGQMQATAGVGFYISPDGDRAYHLEKNPSPHQVEQYDIETPWDITTLSSVYDKSLSGTNHQGLFFKPDGSKMYIIDQGTDKIHEWNLGTNWSVETATDSQNHSIQAGSAQTGIFFSADGKNLYICSKDSSNLDQYVLGTGWDVSTLSYVRSLDISGREAAPWDVFFKPDGTEMYIIGTDGDEVNQYTLPAAVRRIIIIQ